MCAQESYKKCWKKSTSSEHITNCGALHVFTFLMFIFAMRVALFVLNKLYELISGAREQILLNRFDGDAIH